MSLTSYNRFVAYMYVPTRCDVPARADGTNWNPSESAFSPANVASGGALGQLWHTSLDGGYIFAEILHVPGLAFASGVQDAVFVATNLNHVYALNAVTGVCTKILLSTYVCSLVLVKSAKL